MLHLVFQLTNIKKNTIRDGWCHKIVFTIQSTNNFYQSIDIISNESFKINSLKKFV